MRVEALVYPDAENIDVKRNKLFVAAAMRFS